MKTFKEVQSKALHLQGDYQRCYEDMMEVVKGIDEILEKRIEYTETYRQSVPQAIVTYKESVRQFRELLGIDS